MKEYARRSCSQGRAPGRVGCGARSDALSSHWRADVTRISTASSKLHPRRCTSTALIFQHPHSATQTRGDLRYILQRQYGLLLRRDEHALDKELVIALST